MLNTSTEWKPREWQSAAFERVRDMERSIVEACPGAGKSSFSGMLAKYWLDSGKCDHVVCAVPSIPIRRGVMRQWNKNFGLKIRAKIIPRRSSEAFRVPARHDATAITYQELSSSASEDIIRMWIQAGWKIGVILDEIHHAASSRSWGERVRTIGHDLASCVCVMSGTPFRTDGNAIELMEYVMRGDLMVANPHYSYTYRDAVEDDVCRPITCRWFNGDVTFVHRRNGTYDKAIDKVHHEWELKEAKKIVFDPNGETMKNLILQVHNDLMRVRSNREYADAAALFVCRPSRQGETDNKHVGEIAKLIERLTNQPCVAVGYDNKDSADKIDAFANSTDPYIAAVNMISEGVDIPRLRMVGFCRYTESEMLFRQISGRVMRTTIKNDPVSSQLYIPAFPKLKEFGQGLWDDAEVGLKVRVEKYGIFQDDPIVDIDNASLGDPPERQPNLLCVDANGMACDGHFDQTSVEKNFIGLAERVIQTHVSYRHWNQVQLAACLQTAADLTESQQSGFASHAQCRSNLCDRLTRRVKMLATIKYGGDYSAAWRREVFDPGVVTSLEDIRAMWTDDKIESWCRKMEKSIEAAFTGQ